jgi:hypothetical protein
VCEGRVVPRWFSFFVPVVGFVVLGVALPLGVLIWLLAHHEPPYVLDRESMGSARSALGGNPVAMRPVSGVLDVVGDGGTTAEYADGSTATMVRAANPSQVVDKFGLSLPEKSSTSFSVGGFTQRDARLTDGRFARTIGTSGMVFAFIARSIPALDRLVAQSAVRPNRKRDIGNTVLDHHAAMAILIGLGWFLAALILATVAVVRAAISLLAPAPSRAGPLSS